MKANELYAIAGILSIVIMVAAGVMIYQGQTQEPDADVSALSAFCRAHMAPAFDLDTPENCDVWAEQFVELYPAVRERCIILADLRDLMFICLDNLVNGRGG